MLDGDVGGVWTDHGRMGVPDEGMTMVDMVNSSNLLVAGSFTDGAIGDVLLGEQELVGLQDSRVHG